ncbi:aldehyde dehydrogenase family protein [Bacillus sp. RAR_GA_16]|uniref:aldehyde dehydrogenase family protein n=1 Tax=Bacillus sp. RAR_GA_16 TaxID=2876774 RepID=UPI001CCA9D46|nr:aldehyde dehydrogenase family protein [Bacillus sp. RAR_GA_16]MCA0171371.1 aldehyde dehydrogenase family protein [Bacillus sp. RAR_GA_16]
MKVLQNYVNGKWVYASASEQIPVHAPSSGEQIVFSPRSKVADINSAVDAASEAFEGEKWKSFKPHERGAILFEMANMIRESSDELAHLETLDTGKPLSQARSDVEAAARYFEYYAGAADKVFGETIPVEPGILDYTIREPVGVTAHIIPWNYPLQVASRSCAAAIATGNTVVMKPAEDTPLTAVKLAEMFDRTALPDGVFNLVMGYGAEAGAALSAHPFVNHITFTGSVETGSAVMTAAARNIVPVTLELGGKSPNLVFADCDQDLAANWVVKSILQNAGQTCSAGSRLLVESSVKDDFLKKVLERMEKTVIGPGEDDPDIGPILNGTQYERIEEFMNAVHHEGGRFLLGGAREVVAGYEGGYYFQPTVIDGLSSHSKVASEEVFGPVLSVFSFDSEEEAIRLANGTEYGLVTGIWTKDIARGHKVAEKVKAGQIFINNYGAGGGIQMPFGGYKKSGFGREKGLEALRNYTQLKNVAVRVY